MRFYFYDRNQNWNVSRLIELQNKLFHKYYEYRRVHAHYWCLAIYYCDIALVCVCCTSRQIFRVKYTRAANNIVSQGIYSKWIYEIGTQTYIYISGTYLPLRIHYTTIRVYRSCCMSAVLNLWKKSTLIFSKFIG